MLAIYRVLVVDDEDIVRQGLKKILLDMELNIAEVDEAQDGATALEHIRAFRPHIVITDIKMPNMDGLELAEAIRRTDRNIKIVILSGYGEFSYAQKAIQYDVADYLLKPFKREKLLDIMTGMIAQLEEESSRRDDRQNYARALSLLQEKVLKEILGGEYKPGEIGNALSNAGIAFPKQGFLVLTFHISHREKDADAHTGLQKFQSVLGSRGISACTFPSRYGHILCVLNLDESDAAELLRDIRNNPSLVNPGFGAKKAYAGASEWKAGAEALPCLFRQAEQALDYRMFKWDSPVLLYPECLHPQQAIHLPSAYYDAVSSTLASGSRDGLNRAVDKLFEFIIGSEQLTPGLVTGILKDLMIHISRYHDDSTGSYHIFSDSLDDIDYFYQSSDSILELRDKMKKMLSDRIQSSHSGKELVDNSAIGYAARYMEKNFSKDLSLDMVANVVSMNSNYFSTLFRKKTGYSFVRYLQKLRVEEAKKLLADPLKRNYEIAAETGFENDKYFCRVFKEQTGMTPQEYREQLNAGKGE